MQNGSMPGVSSISERPGPEELVQGPSKKKSAGRNVKN